MRQLLLVFIMILSFSSVAFADDMYRAELLDDHVLVVKNVKNHNVMVINLTNGVIAINSTMTATGCTFPNFEGRVIPFDMKGILSMAIRLETN